MSSNKASDTSSISTSRVNKIILSQKSSHENQSNRNSNNYQNIVSLDK